MRLPRRRLRPARRLGRPGRAPAPADPGPLPLEESPTGIDVVSVRDDLPRASSSPAQRAQESTVEMLSVREEIAASPASGPPARPAVPRAPQKVEFVCPCGARLIATPETYDKHSRCAVCQAVLLLSLVYDGDCGSFEIVPFPVRPTPDP